MKRIGQLSPNEWTWELEENYQIAEELLQDTSKDTLIEWYLHNLTEQELTEMIESY